MNSEQEYMVNLVKDGEREDGRKPLEMRDLKVEINTLSQANGSARVRLGNTEVIVGVKFDLSTPYPDSPDKGAMMTSGELPPLAHPRFESGPPKENAVEFSRVVDRAIRESGMIDFESLCIEEGEKVWMVFLDIAPINNDGNLFDASVIGCVAALQNAVFPKYDKKTGKVDHKERTKNKLKLKQVPIMCTFGKLNGDTILLDATDREERLFDARVSIATTEKGEICAMQKGGFGTFTEKQILDLVDVAIKEGKNIRKKLK